MIAVIAVFFSEPAWAGKDKPEKEKVPETDPYTCEEAKVMKEAGYERFGPFPVSDTHGTSDIKTLIGAEWMLWVETKHFKIGSRLHSRPVVRTDRDVAKRLDKELARLHKKIPRIKKKPKELDEWLILHLFAQRLETLYEEISQRFDVKEGTFPGPGDRVAIDETGLGPYLGCRGKFIVLLFEEDGNQLRYLARFMKNYRDKVVRYQLTDPDCMLFAASRAPYDTWQDQDTAFYCYVAGNMVRNLTDGYRRYRYNLPQWWTEGLTHWFVRRICPTFFSPTLSAEQDSDWRKDHNWEKKVYARIKNDYFRPARELLTIGDPTEMDFADHVMSWSRVDFLIALGDDKIGKFMQVVNEVPDAGKIEFETVLAYQEKALEEAWGFDADGLDEAWTQWVLKTYKNVKKRRY